MNPQIHFDDFEAVTTEPRDIDFDDVEECVSETTEIRTDGGEIDDRTQHITDDDIEHGTDGKAIQDINKVREARQKLKEPRNIIDTVVVDPDDVIEALRFNGRPPEYKNQRSAAIRISPSFESESGTSIFYTEEGNYYPPEMNPKPIHINPRVFVGENIIDQPIRSDERARAKDELDDPTEEEIEEFVNMAFEVWEGEVRNRLKTEADINDSELQHGEPHMVEVRYE